MYSRSYYPESNERLSPPNNYDGTAFMDRPESEICIEPSDLSQDENEDIQANCNPHSESLLGENHLFSGLFEKNGLLGGLGLKMPTIGTEEILIIATAAFLLFSKNGDRECALILLLLLFIN